MLKFNLPEKISNVSPSIIREIVERGANIPNFISLALGSPAAEAIPLDEILQSINEILSKDPVKLFQYGPQTGYQPLVEWIKKYVVETKGFKKEENEVLLLSGSGHGLGLAPRVLCNEGDEVFMDEFTFVSGINSVKVNGCVAVGISVDEFGMIPSALDEAAKSGKGKYIYLIPNFHNPLGMTMPLKRRKEIYEIARKHNLVIYEDDPYGDIRFKGEEVPTFKSFDEDNRVIYAGSFSKTLCPGLRVGYFYADKNIINEMLTVKSAMDGQAPLLNQIIVFETLKKLDLQKHLKKLSSLYGAKCKVMTDALNKYCKDKLTYISPDGGMFVWATLPSNIKCDEFVEKCMEKGVGVVKSEGFAVDPINKPGNSIRLNYTFESDEKIEKGISIIGEILKEFNNMKL